MLRFVMDSLMISLVIIFGIKLLCEEEKVRTVVIQEPEKIKRELPRSATTRYKQINDYLLLSVEAGRLKDEDKVFMHDWLLNDMLNDFSDKFKEKFVYDEHDADQFLINMVKGADPGRYFQGSIELESEADRQEFEIEFKKIYARASGGIHWTNVRFQWLDEQTDGSQRRRMAMRPKFGSSC